MHEGQTERKGVRRKSSQMAVNTCFAFANVCSNFVLHLRYLGTVHFESKLPVSNAIQFLFTLWLIQVIETLLYARTKSRLVSKYRQCHRIATPPNFRLTFDHCLNFLLVYPFVGSENKMSQQQSPVVYMAHHSMNVPIGVQIPPVAAGGLTGGQMPLPPPPKPPLNLQQPPGASVVPQGLPQPLPTLATSVPNTIAKSGHIPSLMSLPLGPTKKFPHNSEYRY